MDWHPIKELVPEKGRRYDLFCRRWNPVSDSWEWRRFANCWQHPNGPRGWHCVNERMVGWRPEWWIEISPPDGLTECDLEQGHDPIA